MSGLGSGTFVLTPENAASGITVSFSGALTAGIVNGSFVEVKFGAFSNPLSTTADRIKLLEDLEPSDKDRTEVSGVVSNVSSSGGAVSFTLDGVNISANASLAVGIANGVQAEVKGTLSAGVLVAESVKVEQESNIQLEGAAQSVNVQAQTLVLDGLKLVVNSGTIFRDDGSGIPVTSFGLANIAAGDHLEASVFVDSSVIPGTLVASRVERRPASANASIKAPVTAAATNSLVLLGMTVDTSSAVFQGANESSVTRSAFLALLNVGTTFVQVNGTFNGSAFTATEVSIET